MEKVKLVVGIWKRYECYNLEIVPSLVSNSHKFEFEGFPIEIKLPTLKTSNKDNPPLTCYRYKVINNKRYPRSYVVHQVDCILNTNKTRKIREDALGLVNVNKFTTKERSSLDKFSHFYESELDTAFEYWLDVLRWCTEQPTICNLNYRLQESTTGAYLIDFESRKRFYRPPLTILLKGNNPIKKKDWNRARNILIKGEDVPIWQLYYANAYQQIEINDTRGYIINLAISSENIIRKMCKIFLKQPINPKYESLVNTISIRRILEDWKKLGFSASEWESLTKERKAIIKLFEERNAIMHRGEKPVLDKQTQIEYGTSVLKFLKQCEKWLEKI